MYNKNFYEKYALASMKFFYGKDLKNFVHSECPDLQNEENSIGVEVTRGISEYEGKFSRLAIECMEKNLPLEERFSYAVLAIIALAVFYGIYFSKTLIQKKHGIKTRQIGRRKEKSIHTVELLMSAATLCASAA